MPDEIEGVVQPNENEQVNETLENEVEFTDDEKVLWEDETSKKVESMLAQKKHWREKHDKLSADYTKLKSELETLKPKKEEKPLKKSDELTTLRSELQEIKLQQSNPSLSGEQIKKAIKWAGAEGIETQDFINSDEFQALIKIQSDKSAAENSTPNPSNRSGSGTSNFAKVTEADVKDMDDATFDKYTKYLSDQDTKSGGSYGGLKIRSSINV